MPAKVRKYNPGFLTDDELVSSFCVHKNQLKSVLQTLRECTDASNPHMIVIGPRGSGKTSLLLRAAAETRRDAELSARLFPVIFPEESYEVGSCGEFWLAALTHLADGTPRRADDPDLRLACAELRAETDDRRLEDLCLAALLDFADREGKRLVLIVENLGMIFAAMTGSHDGWRLRHTLQTEPRIVLLASAVSRLRQIDDSDEAFYGFLQPVVLPPLGTGECAALWEYVSGRPPRPEAVRPMQILTGGSPRPIAIVARFGSGLSFRELMADLLDLIDDHTDYFKSHLDALPPQERRVFLALAELWRPATAREVAARARLDTSKCSAQLRRLRERGAVRDDAGAPRRKQYYVTERLYNIYYLLRRRRGGADRLVEALIRFMSSYYSPSQLVDIGVRMASDAAETVGEMRDLHRAALERPIEAPALNDYRDRLRIAYGQLNRGDFKAAMITATRALETEQLDYEGRLAAYAVRVLCHCAIANRISAERDVVEMLRTLMKIESLPKQVVGALLVFSRRFGARRAVRLIETSAVAERLLPLSTALRRELGENPGVAREISEVADDIRRDFAKLKTVRSPSAVTGGPDPASSGD